MSNEKRKNMNVLLNTQISVLISKSYNKKVYRN